ncbi:unnamed protein product [Peniophora sp. CBMAI 1063]|nr:unnamed protein product [Peniophora sp. CBMAI 1063]
MHTVFAPQPTRLVIVDPAQRDAPLFPNGMPSSSSSRMLIEDDDPFISHSTTKPKPESISYPRLLSPIALPDRSRKLFCKSPTPCSSIKKSSTLNAPRSPRRRRHGLARPTRRPCNIAPLVFPRPATSVFDDLAWASTLDDPSLAQDPWAIADLSALPLDRSSGPGPVRRRKLSTEARTELEPLRIAELARASMRTPPPRHTPGRDTTFRELMPVWTPQCAP